jgi:16S rRNA (cytosine967-C5)-methyltransferase
MAIDVRAVAIRVLRESADRFVDDVIEKHRAALDPRDRAFLTTLVYGATRHRLTLDWLVDRHAKHVDAMLRPVFRVALFQILFLDRVPSHAAVDTAVEIAKRESPGVGKFVNAILRKVLGETKDGIEPLLPDDRIQRLSIEHSHPQWLVQRWAKRFGRKTESILRADNLVLPVTAHRLGGGATFELEGDPTKHPDWSKLIVQDATAALVAPLLDPKPGERIVDLCASPGGKTCHLADLMHDRGEIVAIDVTPDKLKPIRENVERLAFKSVKLVVGDGTKPPVEPGVDGVLVDAPCSNTGVLARRPDARWRITPDDPAKMAEIQKRLLAAALELVKPGGRVVYSTCSLEPEENEDVVAGRAEKEVLTLPTAAAAGGYMARIVKKPVAGS